MPYEIPLRTGREVFCSPFCASLAWLATPTRKRDVEFADTRCALCALPLREGLWRESRSQPATLTRLDCGAMGREERVPASNRAVSEAAWRAVWRGTNPTSWRYEPGVTASQPVLNEFRTVVADFHNERAYVETFAEGGVSQWVRADVRLAPETPVEARLRRLRAWRIPRFLANALPRECGLHVHIPWPDADLGRYPVARVTDDDLAWWVERHFLIDAPLVRVGPTRATRDECGRAVLTLDLFPPPVKGAHCVHVQAVQVRHDTSFAEGDRVIAPGRRELTAGFVVTVDGDAVRVVWGDDALEVVPREELDHA